MGSSHNWRNSFPYTALLFFSGWLWIATVTFLLVIWQSQVIDTNRGTIIAVIVFATIVNILIFISFTFFAHDLATLWRMLESFEKNNPQKPGKMFQVSIAKMAVSLYNIRIKCDYNNAKIQEKQRLDLEKEKEEMLSRQVLANNLNHEIKTPIGIIQGYIDTLIEHDNEIAPEMRRHFLEKCLENTLRLQNMAYNMSVITRIENGKEAIQLDTINLVDTLNNVLDDLTPIFEKAGIRAINKMPQELMVRSNANVLYNIFSNLSKNAAFYSGGTEIIVEMIDEKHISFRDNGKGVEEQYLEKIFNRFYRVDRDKNRNLSSSGLGLSIVKEAVEMHGWTISAHNHPDGGLQFIIAL